MGAADKGMRRAIRLPGDLVMYLGELGTWKQRKCYKK